MNVYILSLLEISGKSAIQIPNKSTLLNLPRPKVPQKNYPQKQTSNYGAYLTRRRMQLSGGCCHTAGTGKRANLRATDEFCASLFVVHALFQRFATASVHQINLLLHAT